MSMLPDAATATPALRLLKRGDYARWDAFVEACPQATFFHKAGWQTVIERVFGHRTWFFFVEQHGHILGVLPLAQVRSRLFGHSLASLPFCVRGGVASTSGAAAQLLHDAAHRLAGSLGVGHLEYRLADPWQMDHPAWCGKDLYVTFQKQISNDDAVNLAALPRKQRAMVRKAVRLGLSDEVDDDLNRFYPCYAHNMHRLGTPVFPRKYFKALKEVFGKACEVRVASLGRDPVAAVMSFYFRDQVLPYYAGSMPLAREVAGNDYMYWALMQAAAAQGVRLFDFGRSKRGTGSFEFKRNWGFTPTPLHYAYRRYSASRLPDNTPLNPKYQLLIRLWKKMPLPLANLVGPHLVRNLG